MINLHAGERQLVSRLRQEADRRPRRLGTHHNVFDAYAGRDFDTLRDLAYWDAPTGYFERSGYGAGSRFRFGVCRGTRALGRDKGGERKSHLRMEGERQASCWKFGGGIPESPARRAMKTALDSSVILDVLTNDPSWADALRVCH